MFLPYSASCGTDSGSAVLSKMIIQNDQELQDLKMSGQKLARILAILARECRIGGTGLDLDRRARELMKQEGGQPAFLHYRPAPGLKPFPAAICVSLNDTVVHGVPEKEHVFRSGDIVTIDGGFVWRGMYTDAALTVVLGSVSRQARKLVSVTREALERALKVCVAGNAVGDIGFAVSSFVYREGFSVPEELGGHGVGHGVHEEPFISNIGRRAEGAKLKPGMVLAIEPMVCMGSGEVMQREDGSFATLDGSLSAHFEHTIVVGEKKPIIVTENK